MKGRSAWRSGQVQMRLIVRGRVWEWNALAVLQNNACDRLRCCSGDVLKKQRCFIVIKSLFSKHVLAHMNFQ